MSFGEQQQGEQALVPKGYPWADYLPNELWIAILRSLPPTVQAEVRTVCKLFSQLIGDVPQAKLDWASQVLLRIMTLRTWMKQDLSLPYNIRDAYSAVPLSTRVFAYQKMAANDIPFQQADRDALAVIPDAVRSLRRDVESLFTIWLNTTGLPASVRNALRRYDTKFRFVDNKSRASKDAADVLRALLDSKSYRDLLVMVEYYLGRSSVHWTVQDAQRILGQTRPGRRLRPLEHDSSLRRRLDGEYRAWKDTLRRDADRFLQSMQGLPRHIYMTYEMYLPRTLLE